MLDDDIHHPCIAEQEQHQEFNEVTPTPEGNASPPPPLSQWRADVLTLSARILFVLGLFLLIPSIIIALSIREPWRIPVDVSTLVLLGVIAFVPRLSFALRTTLLLSLIYGVAVLWLTFSGLLGSGRLYFVLLMLLAALLLNLRGALLVGLLALLSVATIYWGFATATLPLPLEIVERMFTPATLTTHWLAQVAVSGIIVAAIVLTINRLQHSIQGAEEARVQLQRLNEQLEQRVTERTAELMQANEHLQAEISERRQAEEALRKSEERFTTFMTYLPGPAFIHDENGRVVFANRTYCQHLNRPPEQVIGQSFSEHVPPEWVAYFRAQDKQVLATQDACVFEDQAEIDGQLQVFLTTKFPVQQADGSIHIGGVAFDITERKQAEEALHENRALLQGVLDHAPALIFAKDLQGRIVLANRSLERLLQVDQGELLGKTDYDFLPPEIAAHNWAFDLEVQRTRQTVEHEEYSTNGDGTLHIYLSIKFPIFDDDGDLTGTCGITSDITERKQMEEALRQSEARLHHVLRSSPVIIFTSHASGEYGATFVSDNVRRVLGYEPGEFIEQSDFWASHIHPDDAPTIFANLPQLFEHDEHEHVYRFLHRDGTYRWMYNVMRLIRDASGIPVEIIGTLEDITARKQAEEALRESEKRLQAIFDNAAVGIGLTDNAGRSILANARGAHQLGYTPEELAQRSNLELTHPDDRAQTVERMQQLVRGEIQGYRIEKRYFRKDGSIFWADLSVSAVYDDDGAIAYILGIVVDITERKQAEKALRESEQRLQAIFDNAAVGIGLTDNAGRSILANARGATQLGYTLEELAQRSNLELTHPDDRAQTVEHIQQLVRGEIQGYRIEKRYFRKDGSIFWADLSVSAVYDDDGQIAYLLGIVVDITERKQLEHQLQQVNMLLQEQAIRDPLTGLYNRRYLDETLPRELQRAERAGQPVGIIMLDIDHFKRINDTCGHDAGDTVLRAVGAFLKEHTRGADIACRYGGEEFTLVLPGASLADTQQRAEDLREGVQTLMVKHSGQALAQVTISLGVAVFAEHGTTAESLIRAADQALYQAKHSGRNRVVVTHSMPDNTAV